MTAHIVDTGILKLVGLKTIFRSSMTAPNSVSQIPELWKELRAAMSQLPERAGSERYSLITGDYTERLPVAYYYALVAVKEFDGIPDSFEKIDLYDKRIAKFVHRGLPAASGKTAMKVLQEWLPESGETISDNAELTIIAADYDRTDPNGEFEYCVFV